jgi:hypothetical protein
MRVLRSAPDIIGLIGCVLLCAACAQAGSLAEWRRSAEALDRLEGHDLWKRKTEDEGYDYHLLQRTVRHATARCCTALRVFASALCWWCAVRCSVA